MLRKRTFLQQSYLDPYANDSNTLILLHLNSSLTNSGIGNSGIGNPVSSSSSIWNSTNKKFGYSSYLATNGVIYFPNSMPENIIKNSLNSDFTIDYWVKVNNTTENYADFYLCGYFDNQSLAFLSAKTYGNNIKVSSNISGDISNFYINSTINASSYYNTGFQHIALIRKSNILYLYVNGRLVRSWTFNITVPDLFTEVSFGGYYYASTYRSTQNNLDEIRFSNVARWDTNFTPPTQEY